MNYVANHSHRKDMHGSTCWHTQEKEHFVCELGHDKFTWKLSLWQHILTLNVHTNHARNSFLLSSFWKKESCNNKIVELLWRLGMFWMWSVSTLAKNLFMWIMRQKGLQKKKVWQHMLTRTVEKSFSCELCGSHTYIIRHISFVWKLPE